MISDKTHERVYLTVRRPRVKMEFAGKVELVASMVREGKRRLEEAGCFDPWTRVDDQDGVDLRRRPDGDDVELMLVGYRRRSWLNRLLRPLREAMKRLRYRWYTLRGADE